MRIRKIGQTTPIIGAIKNNYSENATDVYSCNYMNNINNILSVGITNTIQNANSGEYKVTFDKIIYSNGNDFTLQSDGKIKCNTKCDIVINGCLRFGYTEATQKRTIIYKNNSVVLELSKQNITATTETIAPYYLSVNANDIIYMAGWSERATNYVAKGTYLTIKRIK